MSIPAAPSVTYSGGTASMQIDPEARHLGDVASVSSPGAFPLTSAQCATHPTGIEWVPDREQHLVPAEIAAVCRRCPGRQECLLWALAGQEQGYWAGTTTADRAELLELGQHSVHVAQALQDRARRHVDEADRAARHARGAGSYWWYRRRGCRCRECRAANSAQRAHERARARARTAAAA